MDRGEAASADEARRAERAEERGPLEELEAEELRRFFMVKPAPFPRGG